MKKSSLYFIYGLLFVIISIVAENRLSIWLATIFAILNIILSIVLYYFEDKYN